jgi:hypothetical protein
MGGACGAYGGVERRGAYGALMWKPEGKRRLGRPTGRWEDNIKMYLEGRMDWIDLAQDRSMWRGFVRAVMNFRVV